MTVAYARSDVRGVSVSPEHGGCGRPHSRDVDSGNFSVNCAACAPFLIEKMGDQWGPHPSKLPLTPDEKAQADIDAEEGKILIAAAGRRLGEQLVEGQQAKTDTPAGEPNLVAAFNGLMERLDRQEASRAEERDAHQAEMAALRAELAEARGEKA
jgi:hypothetical protein